MPSAQEKSRLDHNNNQHSSDVALSRHERRSAFWRGYRDCCPFILVVAPFGLLFGAVSTEAGLNLIETMTMTVLVIAGAAQFTALALLEEQAPTLIVIIAALAVNLRMAMYSDALVPHIGSAPLRSRALAAYFLVDQLFAVAVGIGFKSVPGAVFAGMFGLYLMQYLFA